MKRFTTVSLLAIALVGLFAVASFAAECTIKDPMGVVTVRKGEPIQRHLR